MSTADLNAIVEALSGPDRSRIEFARVRSAWLCIRVPGGDRGAAVTSRGGATPLAAAMNLLAEVEAARREETADADLAPALQASLKGA